MSDFKAPLPSKHRAASSDEPTAKRARMQATVQDSDEDLQDDGSMKDNDDNENDIRFAPGNDADYFIDEDSEGRFFGGGLSSTQKEILNIFEGDNGADQAEDPDGSKSGVLTVQAVRRQLLSLERAINKNNEMRIKWSGQPDKFLDSEVALDTAITALALLTQDARLFYPEILKLGVVNSLVDLLSHENVDISIAVIQALEELTDDDVLEGQGEDEDDAQGSASARDAVVNLADALADAQLVELSIDNLNRLTNEENEEQDRSGVYHTLGLVENLLSLKPSLSNIIATKTKFIQWLLKRLQPPAASKENGTQKGKQVEDPALAQNRYYAAELLAIILQDGEAGREARLKIGKEKGIEAALEVLSIYRKRDPQGADETEYAENVFDLLCSALSEPANKAVFLQEEGVELMVIMMKEKMMARNRAIKVLDHALTGDAGTEACERFIEVLGLKYLLSAFINKDGKDKKKASSLTSTEEEHILSILVALLTNLPSDSIPRIRLLKKFVEDEYTKVTRLISHRTTYISRVRNRETELEQERGMLQREGLELDEVDQYLRRLDAGLYSLQLADYILAWLCMEDDGVRDHARALLAEKGSSFAEVIAVLNEYKDNIGDATVATSPSKVNGHKPKDGEGEGEPVDEASKQKLVISHLVDYLRSC